MAKVSKRLKALRSSVEANKLYAIDEAIALVKKAATAKFDESVDVSFNLGVDPRKSDQVIRGSVVLPKGTGKTTRVAVFTQGANADAAKEAGADVVGFEDLAAEIKAGNLNFDVVIASPDAMRIVGQLGTILGPRGLMPNPKVGTVTPNVAEAVKNAKAGQVQYRTDKAGIVHATIGRASFAEADLKENFDTLLDAIVKAKPAAAKGAGADVVGFEDLAAEIKAGNLNFDVVIASPDAMRIVGQLGTILGPRGLMPNPKVGTVTPNVAEAVKNAKAGQVQYRTDKAGIVHATIGRASFAEADLKENFDALLDAIVKARPAAAKGQYLKKVAVSSTMGLGVRVDTLSMNN